MSNKHSLRLGTRITNALNAFAPFNLLDDAIADLLCIKTHTHGTSPKSYNGIMNNGGDPARGGKGGESSFYKFIGDTHSDDPNEKSGWNCKNRFFVCLDEGNTVFKRVMPRIYTLAASVGENCTYEESILKKIPLILISLLEGWCSPILKFRFAPNNPIQFEPDTTGFPEGFVGYSTELLPADNIGLYGTLHESFKSNWIERIRSNPEYLARGVLKLATLVASMVLVISAINIYPWVGTACTIYLAVCSAEALGRLVLPLIHQALDVCSKPEDIDNNVNDLVAPSMS